MNKTIMVAMAHANDMETYAGGTVAKFVSRGYKAVLVLLTNSMAGADLYGDGNYMEHDPAVVMSTREAEAHDAASELGVESIIHMGFKDSAYFDGERVVTVGDEDYDMHHAAGGQPLVAAAANARCVAKMQQVIEKLEPEVIITHNLTSGYEHTAGATLVNQAFSQAVRDGCSLGSLWTPAVVRHRATDDDIRQFASPDVIIDVTAHWADKLRALRAHKSQNVEPGVKKLDVIARYWGIVRQCRYAEPFFTIYDARYR